MGEGHTTRNTDMARPFCIAEHCCRECRPLKTRVRLCACAQTNFCNQQCQLVTPLQLYFSYKSAFENFQVILSLASFVYGR